MQRLVNPVPLFLDSRGDLLDSGKIFIGQPNQDPEAFPLQVYWNAGLTVAATQPLRTLGGGIVNGSAQAFVFFSDGDYSFRIRDADSNQVTYVPSVAAVSSTSNAFQPLSPTLSSISNITSASYGRNLLALTNQAALQAAVGYVPGIPSTGGPVSGNITRLGAGVHAYFADPAMTGGRIFVTALGASDPTSQPGDLWVQY